MENGTNNWEGNAILPKLGSQQIADYVVQLMKFHPEKTLVTVVSLESFSLGFSLRFLVLIGYFDSPYHTVSFSKNLITSHFLMPSLATGLYMPGPGAPVR